MSLHPLRGDRRVQVSALALMSSLAMTTPVKAVETVNEAGKVINSGSCSVAGASGGLCTSNGVVGDGDAVINRGQVDVTATGFMQSGYGAYAQLNTVNASASMLNAEGGEINVRSDQGWGGRGRGCLKAKQ